ncbi:MAG: signal peptidase I [Betaproteobacteria bacterium]
MIPGEERYGWMAALLALLFTPFTGMLYAGAGRRGVFYLLLMLAAILLLPWAIPSGLQAPFPAAPAVWLITFLLIWFVGIVDSYRVAAQHNNQYALPWYSRWHAIVSCWVALYLVFVAEQAFLVEPLRVVSSGMAPTVQHGDYVGVAKSAYAVRIPFSGQAILETEVPERGDVVLLRFPQKPLRRYVQRVVGIPGDIVEYRNKRLSLNGQVFDTLRTGKYAYVSDDSGTASLEQYEETANGRPHSILIDGQAPVLRLNDVQAFRFKESCAYAEDGFQCKVPPRHYFTLQDNRDHADDGRYWGFVPEENLVGKVFAIGVSLRFPEHNGTVVK